MKSTIIALLFLALLFLQGADPQIASQDPTKACPLSLLDNVLTPNGNDKLTLILDCPVVKFKFTLFNRWGNKLYSCSEFSNTLDLDIYEKTKKDSYKYPDGVYIWVAEYTVQLHDREEKRTTNGNLTIMKE